MDRPFSPWLTLVRPDVGVGVFLYCPLPYLILSQELSFEPRAHDLANLARRSHLCLPCAEIIGGLLFPLSIGAGVGHLNSGLQAPIAGALYSKLSPQLVFGPPFHC